MVTVEPVPAEVGVNETIVGVGIQLKPDFKPVPPMFVTLTSPLNPAPTVAVIKESELTVKLAAGVFPNLTELTPVKLLPEMLTVPD